MKKFMTAVSAVLFLSLALGLVLGPAAGMLSPVTAKASFGIQIPVIPLNDFAILAPTPRQTLIPDKTPKIPAPKPTNKPSSGSSRIVMNNEGPLFLSFRADLTKDLLMFTPMDLSLDGEIRVPLIGNEDRVVGEAKVLVQSGMVIVTYLVNKGVKVDERNEFFTFFTDIHAVPSVEPKKLQEMKLKFGIPYNIQSLLNSDSRVLLYLNTPVSYNKNQAGLTSFSFADPVYLEKMMALILLMD